MPKAVVIIPTYNERTNVPLVVARIEELKIAADLLFVDGNSPDGTGKLIEEIAVQRPFVHVLHQKEKNGLGRAYIAGFAWALARDYEFILEMDADLSHNPADITPLIEAAQTADLALGSRYINGIRVINWPMRRLLLSTGAAQYVRIITGMPFTDPTGGYKCFRRKTLERIQLDQVLSNGYSFQIELTHRAWRQGLRIVEVPIIFTERAQGASKMSGRIVREAITMVWRLLWQNRFRRSPRHAS
jgi:dolichol-phosphate mannosyltransferase